jgi:predicted DNA-binding transcriptional regulator AlpA
MQQRLRFADLRRLGVVKNRQTLQNWIKDRGFPSGALLSPHCRSWSEAEVQAWLDARPASPKVMPVGNRRGRPRKIEAQVEA